MKNDPRDMNPLLAVATNSSKITVKAVYYIRTTEWQFCNKNQLNDRVNQANYPCSNHEQNILFSTHNSDIVERLTYGNIAIKGHGDEQHHLHTTNDVEEDDLSDTTTKGDDFTISEKVINHLGRDDRRNSRSMKERLANRKYMGECK